MVLSSFSKLLLLSAPLIEKFLSEVFPRCLLDYDKNRWGVKKHPNNWMLTTKLKN